MSLSIGSDRNTIEKYSDRDGRKNIEIFEKVAIKKT